MRPTAELLGYFVCMKNIKNNKNIFIWEKDT